MDNTKFHDIIGIEMERITRNRGVREFTADEIDAGSFVDAMFDVLKADTNKIEEYSAFFNMCREYHGKHNYDIPYDGAKALFDVFKKIIGE